jgi:hypothetical protein
MNKKNSINQSPKINRRHFLFASAGAAVSLAMSDIFRTAQAASAFSLLGGILSLVTGPVVFLLVTPFLGLMLWAEIVCLKSPYYRKKGK